MQSAGEFPKSFSSVRNKIRPKHSGDILWQGSVGKKEYVGGRTEHGFVVQSREDWDKWAKTGNFFALEGNRVIIHAEDPDLTRATDECLHKLNESKQL